MQRVTLSGVALLAGLTSLTLMAQPPAGGRGGGQAGGRGGGRAAEPAGGVQPLTGLPLIGRSATVDDAAADRGKLLWSANCITCHGTQARGSNTGPNLVRSDTANYDRYAAKPGDVLGPFLKKGHPTQSGKPSASFTDAEVADLANFIRQRINDTMRGSPTYIVLPENLLTGDAKAGEASFSEFGCGKCHNDTTRNLKGIATKINNPQTLQGMVLYPSAGGGRGGRGGGRGGPAPTPVSADGNPPGPQPPNPLAMKVTLKPAAGPAMEGTLVDQDAFFITYSDPTGTQHTVRKTPELKITTENPMQWHTDFADQITDKQMHDLTAYLWTMK